MSITFAEKLATMRRELHFRPEDVARCLGVPVDKIHKYELGALEPTFSDLCALMATYMTRFDFAFSEQLELAMADVHARIADYVPNTGSDPRSVACSKSFTRLKDYLNQPCGGAV